MSPEPQTSIVLLNALNIEHTVYLTTPGEALGIIRAWVRKGYRPKIDIPAGGIQLPYTQHDTFDFALLGARPALSKEGDMGVWHGGHFYKKRVLEAVDSRKLKLPAAIKYSRGAKTTDPTHLREKSDGEFEYVTLVIFRGRGQGQADLNIPGGGKHLLAGLETTRAAEAAA